MFELSDLHCQSCAAVIPITLQVTDGIEDAGLDGNTLTVEYKADTITAEDVADILEDAGYTV